MLAKRLEGVVGTIRHAHVLLQQNNRIDQRFRRTCASSTNDDSSISSQTSSLQCTINNIPGDVAEEMSDILLMEGGALSASIIEYRSEHAQEQKIYKQGTQAEYWKTCSIQACFPTGIHGDDMAWPEEEASIREHVRHCLEDAGMGEHIAVETIAVIPIRPGDWESNIRGEYQSMKIDDALWIIPSWSEIQDESAMNITLQPGLAFGTGSHPTTRMCLMWLHSLYTRGKLHSESSVLDYGMGSGVLAIAALVMGASHAVGTDIEALSLKAATYNASLNNVQDRLEVYQVSEDGQSRSEHDRTHDVIVANILRGPLIELASTLASYIHKQEPTLLGLSGITLSQSEDVKAAYSPWFENFEVHIHHEDDDQEEDGAEWTNTSGSRDNNRNVWVLITATSRSDGSSTSRF
ncbi:hypothetical protein M9434_000566 [Picochlorum sp. BPE23]|nr:hypothetical protein M9434_000566 [Picochlorum sp. BPE23]